MRHLRKSSLPPLLLLAVLGLVSGPLSCTEGECTADVLSGRYTRYIEPFVSGAVPSSCSQCHMTGIDISIYAQDTPCQTMACLVDSGEVNLGDPDGSAILDKILMGDTESSVFDVNNEYEAMRDWISWSAECDERVCGDLESPCDSGTGALTTGIVPLGDCSEQDLLTVFWDGVIVDRWRCASCHTVSAKEQETGATCTSDSQCEAPRLCLDGQCRRPGIWQSPSFFEGTWTATTGGGGEGLNWNNPEHQTIALNTLYNIVALDLIDIESPLDSELLSKPLLEGFQPTEVHATGVDVTDISSGVGLGLQHGGGNKFKLGCSPPDCPTEGVIDCSSDVSCHPGEGDCEAGQQCLDNFCRTSGSYCDETYTDYVRFIEYFASCKGDEGSAAAAR
jgi:hypothetical protein